MLAQKPLMGWNPWNTFGTEISEALLKETADTLVKTGYRDAGYTYIVIDDGWSLRHRDENGKMIPDPAKFPNGIKSTIDYIHSKGLKFGLYSCAGVRTCADYPGSYDHEFVDARSFAEWEVDYLKYDFCNFPHYGNNKMRYLTMSMALKATGRDIIFSACNWGREKPQEWMRAIGAHLYRSDTDIRDTFESMRDIIKNQKDNFNHSAPGCFNDIDMLTVGMFGEGLVGKKYGKPCTFEDYKTQFAFWCLFGVPLMIGSDIRNLNDDCKQLLQNKGYLEINQDEEGRPPFCIQGEPFNEDGKKDTYIYMKMLSKGEFALGLFNLKDCEADMHCLFADIGVPYYSEYALQLTDVDTGENLGLCTDEYRTILSAHGSKLFRAKWVDLHA